MWYDWINEKQSNSQRKVPSMYYSIQHFIEKDIKEIEKGVKRIITGEIDAEDLSEDIQERVLKSTLYQT